MKVRIIKMDVEALTIKIVDDKDVFFRNENQPIKAKSQQVELERMINLLTGEEFEDYDGKYKRKLINPDKFKLVQVYQDAYGSKYTCLCGENTCNHLIITKYIPTDIYFAVGSVCIERFNEDNSKALYNLKIAKKCEQCQVSLVFKDGCRYPKNSSIKYNGVCVHCWNENKIIYLNIPCSRKDEAKSKGTKWNPDLKTWYIYTQNKNRKSLIETFGIKNIL